VAVGQAAISDLSDESQKARRFSIFSMCLGSGFAVGPVIGGFFADTANGTFCGYATPFALAGLISLFNFTLVTFKFPTKKPVLQDESKGYHLLEGLFKLKQALYWTEYRPIFLGTAAP
jgi:DHA1 family tetracycline resistance protein-like MFS transporter